MRGMIVGENARQRHGRERHEGKKQTNMRASSADEAIRLIPPRLLGLERRLEHQRRRARGELLSGIRLRKKVLTNMRRSTGPEGKSD